MLDRALASAPGRAGLSAALALLRHRWDALGTIAKDYDRFGDVVEYRFGGHHLLFVRRPEHVAHVLQDHHTGYRRSFFYDRMKPLLGEGLLTSDGAPWLRNRRLIQPAFKRERLAGMVGLMVRVTDRVVAAWEAAARRGEPVDAAHDVTRLTLATAGHAFFHADVDRFGDLVGRELDVAIDEVNRRMTAFWNVPLWWPSWSNLRSRLAVRRLHALVDRIVEERAACLGDDPDPDDVLGRLLRARDEEGGLTAQQVRDEVLTMLLAGHETTANLLAWTIYLLGKHPEEQERLAAEVTAAVGEAALTAADLDRLPRTHMVLKEAMRLYPPAWIMDRQAVEDDAIGGFRVAKGAVVALTTFSTHRLADLWKDPDGFRPEHFSPEEEAARPRFSYYPFGGGPRMCIGMHFAMLEAAVALAMLARRFRWSLVAGHRVEADPKITLRVRSGVLIRLENRVA